MGTSGLRQTQEVYNQPLFLEQFTQGIALYFKEITDNEKIAENNKTILLGGDPRKGNWERIEIIAKILIGNGFSVIIPENGLASTPAISHGIRKLKTVGGIILTASHNPFTDVGIKINMADGSPALDNTVLKIHEIQNNIDEIILAPKKTLNDPKYVKTVNIIKLYAELLDEIFNFNDMKEQIKIKKTKAAFDSMHGAAGPFAEYIFDDVLGLNAKYLRVEPREDLGGFDENGEPMHPEPDFDFIPELIKLNSTKEYDLVSAWDSDVDRRLDGGSGFFVESADEFALFAKYSELINIKSLFKEKIYFCRSTVTTDTIDKMKDYLNKKFSQNKVFTIETPTGFKWIAELGNWGVEESNGVGNPYLREKDGIFSTVFLLKIILHTGKTVQELVEEIWEEFGRVYFTRGEVSGSKENEKIQLTDILNSLQNCTGKKFGELVLESGESWSYIHPETGEVASKNAAWVLNFSNGNTIKARFSGTGSSGYLLRVYCSKYDRQFNIPKSEITEPMKNSFNRFLSENGFSKSSDKYTDEHQPDIYTGK